MALEPLILQHRVLVFWITPLTPLWVSLGFSWSRVFQVCLLYLDTGVCPSASLTSRVCKAMWPQPQKVPACACSWLEASSVTPAGCTGTGWVLRANTPHRYWNGTEEVVLKSVTSRGCRSILRTLFCFVLFFLYFDFKKTCYLLVNSASVEKDRKDLRKLL